MCSQSVAVMRFIPVVHLFVVLIRLSLQLKYIFKV